MKKVILLIALFYSFSFGQGWNSTLTPITESTLEKMDLFTNKNGNHLLIKRSNGNIVHYNFDSQGQINMSNPITLESNGDFPTITGNNDIVYAFYKAGSYIKLKYSTDGGASWVYDSNLDVDIGSNDCNGIDAVYESSRGVHIVWATMDSGSDFETYYYRLTPYPNPSWTDYKPVTDYNQYEVGGAPTVTFSQDRIHVSYNLKAGVQTIGYMKTRDKYNGTWQVPQFISTTDESVAERLLVRGSNLYAVYGKFDSGIPNSVDAAYKYRSLSGSWTSGSGTVIEYSIGEDPTSFNAIKTYNDKLQLVYEKGSNLLHRSFDGSWSGTFTLDGSFQSDLVPIGLANASNDFFVTWKRYGNNYIYYRQYDYIPLAPQGLTPGIHHEGGQTYAKINWQFNNEPDVYIKQNAFEIWRRIKLWDNPWGPWGVVGYKNGDITEFIEYEIIGPFQAEVYTAEYKIRARDMNNHYSPYSDVVTIEFAKLAKRSSGKITFDYNLLQNYPNPFNPTTTISYSIKTAGLVTLKVYDMLGSEVASLINERKEPGNYNVTFDADNLPSGIYVYRLTTNNFVDSKKLILMK